MKQRMIRVSDIEQLRGKDRLRNDIIDLIKSKRLPVIEIEE